MDFARPSEVYALREQIERLESECQRLREVISQKADNEAYLTRRTHDLRGQVTALRGELRIAGRPR